MAPTAPIPAGRGPTTFRARSTSTSPKPESTTGRSWTTPIRTRSPSRSAPAVTGSPSTRQRSGSPRHDRRLGVDRSGRRAQRGPTEDSASSFDSGEAVSEEGATFEQSFDNTGIQLYYCTPQSVRDARRHPGRRGVTRPSTAVRFLPRRRLDGDATSRVDSDLDTRTQRLREKRPPHVDDPVVLARDRRTREVVVRVDAGVGQPRERLLQGAVGALDCRIADVRRVGGSEREFEISIASVSSSPIAYAGWWNFHPSTDRKSHTSPLIAWYSPETRDGS